MCGVVGYSGSQHKGDRRKFISLCREACIRGVHAFGIAYIDNGLKVFKSQSFVEVMNAIPDPIPSKIIFHNRYSTSGDATVMHNNQPIHVGDTVLVFNGTVDMGTKAEMEMRCGFKMQTENDGEIVLHDFCKGEPLKHICDGQSFAGIFLCADGRMFAIRNENRPLWVFREGGGKFITSTLDIASRAGFGKNNGKPLEPLAFLEL